MFALPAIPTFREQRARYNPTHPAPRSRKKACASTLARRARLLYFFRIVKEQPISSGSGNQKQTAGETRLPLASGFCAANRGWTPARWWSWTGSNRRPPACKAGALPTELQPLSLRLFAAMSVVGLDGFEPSTPALSRRCSNQLSYRPAWVEIGCCSEEQPIDGGNWEGA